MNQYTVSVAVHHKKLLRVNAVDEDEAIEKAEITVFDTDALKYDGDDLVSAEFDIFLPRDASETESVSEINPCDIYCSGCPDYDSEHNFCKKTSVCGEEYDFPPASGEKNG